MKDQIEPNTGSFRDPVNKVYEVKTKEDGDDIRILRGLSADAFDTYIQLSKTKFFNDFIQRGQVVETKILDDQESVAQVIKSDGWAGVLEHKAVPFVTYPYEWTFNMLKDAALLHLHLIEKSLKNGWTLKDATPFNIQWIGPKPIFIDVPSFEPWTKGEPWVGYRQFCSMFLTPLMMKAHLDIDHLPIMRSYIDGVSPVEANKFFQGRRNLKKGVLSHIVLPARVENSILKNERDDAPAKVREARPQSEAMVIGLVQSLSRLVKKLSISIDHTDWSQYDKTHTYQETDYNAKKAFVLKQASLSKRDQVWDIGCNTGTFSKISSEFCNQVLSIDGDHNAVEQLYLREKENKGSNILPIVMNLSNISPAQGWAGVERLALDGRKKPDLVLCLALIHHVRISANIPNKLFLKWLRSLEAEVVLEFVTRQDEMVIKLLTNKKEQYPDYNISQFIIEAEEYFEIADRASLKEGKREIFFLKPK